VATSPLAGLEPTQDERTMAALAQALSIFGFIPPLVFFLIKRESRFVSFHALQALLWHIAYMIVIIVAIFGFFVILIFIFIVAAHSGPPGGTPPIGILFVFPFLWLILMAIGIANLIVAIVYAIKAGQGEWATYPLLGNLARKILKLSPTGPA
jgi:uncharacterized membrane protein